MTTTTGRPSSKQRHGWQAWLGSFFTSDIGMKWMMALTGIGLLLYVVIHMLGNLKIFFGPEEINHYGEALRDLGGALVPRTHLLWIMRFGLIAAFAIHIWAAAVLTRRNWAARGKIRYDQRNYVAANYAARTMRWGGIIVLLFVFYHLADLTWGLTNPDFVRGDPYHNIVESFSRWWVALFYIIAQVVLALHIYHGAWSMFQSLGLSNPRYNDWRRALAVALAAVILVGNCAIVIAVQTGIVS